MFKGLRTKIENEKQTSSSGKAGSSVQDKIPTTVIQQKGDQDFTNFTLDSSSPVPKSTAGNAISQNHTNRVSVQYEPGHHLDKNHCTQGEVECTSNQDVVSHGDEQDILKAYTDRISQLETRLSTIIGERDESNEQNAQLYQLIEKLRRNLEVEKETNTSLTSKLNEFEQALKVKDCRDKEKQTRTIAIPNISFNPDKLSVNDARLPEDVVTLQAKLKDLQRDLSKKNRQLKIYQQNLIDIRKTLQQEISAHSKSREEIQRLESELRESATSAQNDLRQDYREIVFNGFSMDDASIRDSMARKNTTQHGSDEANSEKSGIGEPSEDKASAQRAKTQPDNISCKSTISSDDIESNDLQKNNKTNKEMSHEYLRNVLYRFLTSTDMETSQRMINAISVLMNFTSDQSAAIKKALQTRSSWLRLK